MALWLAVSFALAFAFTNGFHDAANAIATLVATRGARPGQAVVLSAVFNMLGALLVGTAVADTIAGIVTVSAREAVAVIGSGVLAAVVWNLLTWWRGLPSSSAHALVGGLVGAALAAGGRGAVNWGGLDGWRPVGVFGVLIALARLAADRARLGLVFARLDRRLLRRATRRVERADPVGEWAMSAALSFSHGANDAQKAMGVIAALLLAAGHLDTLTVPLWVKLACGAALTVGTAMGGWRIVRTIGRRIFRLGAARRVREPERLDRGDPARVLRSARPVSTTQVVASSVVGVGGGRRRWRHVRWAVVRAIAFAWLLTLPASAALGAVSSWSGGGRMRPRRWFLPETPDVLGDAARADRDHGRGDGRARRLGRAARRRRATGARLRAPGRRLQARAACGADHGVHDPARARGHLRALARARRGPQQREEHRARGGGDAGRARRGDRRDGRAARRRDAAQLAEAFAALGAGPRRARHRGGRPAVKSQRHLEHVYRRAMSALVEVDDLREVAAQRELYRRLARTSDDLLEVAERVWYSVLKES